MFVDSVQIVIGSLWFVPEDLFPEATGAQDIADMGVGWRATITKSRTVHRRPVVDYHCDGDTAKEKSSSYVEHFLKDCKLLHAPPTCALPPRAERPAEPPPPPPDLAGLFARRRPPPGWTPLHDNGKIKGYRGPDGGRVQTLRATWIATNPEVVKAADADKAAAAADKVAAAAPATLPAARKRAIPEAQTVQAPQRKQPNRLLLAGPSCIRGTDAGEDLPVPRRLLSEEFFAGSARLSKALFRQNVCVRRNSRRPITPPTHTTLHAARAHAHAD